MPLLKCNKCGFLNEVKSEYLVFCGGCNRKLENNFSEWKKKNPDKTLDDFKQLVCVAEDEIQKSTPEIKPRRPTGLKYWIGFTIAFGIFYALGQYGGESIVRFFRSEKTSADVLEQKWSRITIGSSGLSVETPDSLTKSDLPLTEEIKQLIDRMEVYNYVSVKGFKIFINSLEYKPEVGSINLAGAANGSVNEVKTRQGVTDFVYTEEAIVRNDIPGFMQKGSFKQDGVEIEFINTGFSAGLHLWQVLVLFESSDKIGKIAANRVIESIEIKNN